MNKNIAVSTIPIESGRVFLLGLYAAYVIKLLDEGSWQDKP